LLEYPASSPYVFAVGATDHNDHVPYWSGMGTALDIVAPGVNLWSFDLTGTAGMNNGSLCNGDPDYYCEYQGTSCATPIVAAIATKLLSTRASLIPKHGPAQPLYDLLANTTEDLYAPGHDYISGWGRVSALRALFALWRGDVNHDFKIDVSDALYIINNVFIGGPDPIPYFYLGDANCDASVDVSDAVWIINYVFVGGAPPPVCYSNLPD
jgi:subtilisin family serine protease